MGTNKVTSSATPSAGSDLTNKTYVDAQRDTRVAKTGDSMSGNLDMQSNIVTGLTSPSQASDATNKSYVDGILGSATAAADSASAAATSETNAANSASSAATSESNAATSESNAASSASAAATSESNAATSETNAANSASAAATSETNAANSASAASTSETNAANSAAAAATSYDNFDDRFLGPKSSDPATDNDGDVLLVGALYFNTTDNRMKVYNGSAWLDAFVPSSDFLQVTNNLSDVSSASTARSNIGLGSADAVQFATVNTGQGDNELYAMNQDVQTTDSVTFVDAEFTGTGAVELPEGTGAQRPGTPAAGMLRFNSDTALFEGYNGTAWSSVGGSEITNDTTTSTDVFPLFADATSGVATDVFTSNTNLLYQPNTGELKVKKPVAKNGIFANARTITEDTTIDSDENAMSAGPVDVADGVTVTVESGARWVVI